MTGQETRPLRIASRRFPWIKLAIAAPLVLYAVPLIFFDLSILVEEHGRGALFSLEAFGIYLHILILWTLAALLFFIRKLHLIHSTPGVLETRLGIGPLARTTRYPLADFSTVRLHVTTTKKVADTLTDERIRGGVSTYHLYLTSDIFPDQHLANNADYYMTRNLAEKVAERSGLPLDDRIEARGVLPLKI